MALYRTRDLREALSVGKDFDDAYARAVEPLPAFGKSLESLIRDLLTRKGILFHGVNHRVKLQDSAERKMARPRNGEANAGPRTLESLTDLLGVRVVTYFQTGIETVAEVIQDEFDIDWKNSVDKQATLDADRFGYLSMHYVAELKKDRTTLPVHQDYDGIKFEIQIRSILQHAWAEMEHDLGYKSEAAVPRDYRRRFSRLAGILELVDDEFVSLQKAIKEYQTQTRNTLDKGRFGVNQDSLSAFVQSSQQIAQLDNLIAGFHRTSVQKHLDEQYLGRQAGPLIKSGFRSIEDLSNYLDENSALLAKFTERWLSDMKQAPQAGRVPISMGITLYYLAALKATREGRIGNEAYRASKPELLRRYLVEAIADIRPEPGN